MTETAAGSRRRAAAASGALPVMLLSGPDGAGADAVAASLRLDTAGTVVLTHSLRHVADGWVQRDLTDARGGLRRTRLPLAHDCVACTLREDVLRTAALLARRRDGADRLLVVSPGVVEPAAVAAALDDALLDGAPLTDVARLSALVTVVDAGRLLDGLTSPDTLSDRGTATALTDDRSVAEVLVAQIEYADALVLTRTETLGQDEHGVVDAVLDRLAPITPRYRFRPGVLPTHRLLADPLYDPDRTPAKAGWARELDGRPLPRTCEHGVSTVVFRSRRPFAPARLHDVLADPFDGLLRSRGFCWLATRPGEVVGWDQAGPSLDLAPCGRWLADGPARAWDELDPDERARVQATWDPYYGDRETELVLTGLHLDPDAITAALEACLLTDGELALGRDRWQELPDPFFAD